MNFSWKAYLIKGFNDCQKKSKMWKPRGRSKHYSSISMGMQSSKIVLGMEVLLLNANEN
jgi:hypothetical protein